MKYLLVLLTFAIFTSAYADPKYDLSGRWGAGIGLGTNTVSGADVYKNGASELDGAFVGGFWARYHYDPRLGVELSYMRLAYDFTNTAAPFNNLDPVTDLVMVSAAYRAWPEEIYHLLLQVGIGYARITDFGLAPDDKNDDFAMSARVGFEYMATPDLALAIQGDYYKINMGSGSSRDLSVWTPMLAMTYYFGGSASAPKAGDRDGDGVADELDKCPGTSAGTAVGGDGCPLKVTTDADKDGVMDDVDQCPGTPSGQKVTEYGCAKTDKLEITLNVQFETGKSSVDPKFTGDLEKFAEFLNKYPATTAEIEGHTDNKGGEKINYSISQRRAQSVRQYLIKTFKIDKKRLTAKGYGPSQPIGDNATEDGRAKNRRVVAHVKTDIEKK